MLNAGSGDRIRPAVGENFSGHTDESGTTGSLGVWGRGASNSLVPSGGPSLHVAVGMRGSCLNHALAAPGCVPIFFGANTLYKVWTGLLAQVMSTYAEHYHLLSDRQEGFRKHRNTMRATVSMLVPSIQAISDSSM